MQSQHMIVSHCWSSHEVKCSADRWNVVHRMSAVCKGRDMLGHNTSMQYVGCLNHVLESASGLFASGHYLRKLHLRSEGMYAYLSYLF
jgi:hypothetical protein